MKTDAGYQIPDGGYWILDAGILFPQLQIRGIYSIHHQASNIQHPGSGIKK